MAKINKNIQIKKNETKTALSSFHVDALLGMYEDPLEKHTQSAERFLVQDQSLYPLPPLSTWTPSVLNLCRSCVCCHSLCVLVLLCLEHCCLEVIHHLWLLQPPLPFCPETLREECLMEISRLRLSSPRYFTLCTLFGCASPC